MATINTRRVKMRLNGGRHATFYRLFTSFFQRSQASTISTLEQIPHPGDDLKKQMPDPTAGAVVKCLSNARGWGGMGRLGCDPDITVVVVYLFVFN